MMKSFIYVNLYLIMLSSLISVLMNSIPSHNKYIHPIMMSVVLLMLSIFLSMNVSILMINHWFSFILFLIIIGGLLILFLYFTSFISNMKTSMNWLFLMILPFKMLLMIMLMFLIIIYMHSFFPWLSNSFNEMINFYSMMNLTNNNMNFQSMYLYMYMKNFSTMIMMTYLLLCLTIIVKLCLKKKFILRKIN